MESILAIIIALVISMINPAGNFADSRNAQRSSDVSQVLNAITQYGVEQGNSIDDFGDIPECVSGSAEIGTEEGMIDLYPILVDDYIVDIPTDPSIDYGESSGYTICRSDERIQIDAPYAENGKVISVKR